ncbi:hypothetical protein CDL15_Pgr019512 [Punica granatum]|uniref:Gamma-tubulin complex component n=1 Tax=Punica granatum TaxID=22663 RepID=A0A218VUI3_PUNGR|nr:hypothetical protein CDL15_Pgr019512 [Punica granatum]
MEILNKENPEPEKPVLLPGWGQWTNVQKKRGLLSWMLKEHDDAKRKREEALKKRKDAHLKHVIISEKVDKKNFKNLCLNLLALLGYTGDLIVDEREHLHSLGVPLSLDAPVSDERSFRLAPDISFIETSDRSAVLQIEQKLLAETLPILATVTQGLNKDMLPEYIQICVLQNQFYLLESSEFHKRSCECVVDSIRAIAASHLWQLVVVRADLNGHLKALKDYFLLAKGDFFQCFLEESRQLMRLPPRQSTAEADRMVPFQLVDVIESQWNVLQGRIQDSHDFTELVGFHQEILDSIMKLRVQFCWNIENQESFTNSSELEHITEEFNKKSNSLYTILRSSRLAGSQRAPFLRRFLLHLNFNSFFEATARGVLNVVRPRPVLPVLNSQ